MKIFSIGNHIKYSPTVASELNDFGRFEHIDAFPDEENFIKYCDKAEILISWGEPTARVIDNMPDLRLFVYMYSGYDRILKDQELLRSLRKNSIKVAYIPKYSTEGVSQFVLSALLAYNRKLMGSNVSTKQSPYELYLSKDLRDCNIGIVGLGSIGVSLAKKLYHLGVNVSAYTRNRLTKSMEIPVNFKSLKEIFENSDFICLTVELNDQTRNMINRELLSVTKQEAVILSIARKEIFVMEELAEVLKARKDVRVLIDDEDVDNSQLPNLTVTPHIAFNTERSLYNCTDMVFHNIREFNSGRPFFEISLN
ncbi:hypothetical protein JMN32_18915 [Fulvivirga sp. 29W222]|uniref:D-isomer specific 2-hydroxyacid dehydrogenase NAD-binding domain-containing protein n=1 Tax=Fulvivirga marina TaxID=2494733 RepID=A0A937G0R1_9BACT|nr:NAD(P)-dependent oxidoreductase [Fulvivirga marina]MBL6448393.1 hypothetical protein [Fulvivirga marina]